jgi:DNA-directed RNA polymerase specialized sigma24 family protein
VASEKCGDPRGLAPIFATLAMLAERVELHAPQCRGASCCSCDPIENLEAFVRAAVLSHLGVGSKRRSGELTGDIQLSSTDVEELICELIGVGWDASRRFNGNGRLDGYVLWILHKRTIDWLRKTFGSTRYGARPEIVPYDEGPSSAAEVGYNGAASYDDYPSDENGRHLDRDALSPHALNQLALLEIALEIDQPVRTVAEELGVPASVRILRREAAVVGSNGAAIPMPAPPPPPRRKPKRRAAKSS